MPDETTHAQKYCSDLVRARDEDRWLAAGYAAAADARRLVALYAFHCELRRIPAAVSEPPLGEIRLQWQRDALARIRAGKSPGDHPVMEEMAAAGLAEERHAADLDAVIDAAARPLYGEGFTDLDDLMGWLRRADGTVDALSVKLLDGETALAERAGAAGAVFALAREGPSLAPGLKDAIAERGRALWRDAAAGVTDAPAGVAPAVLHLALTRAYLKRGGAGPFPVMKRLRLFAAMAAGRV